MPDPVDCDTYLSARLPREERTAGIHAEHLSHYRRLIEVRKAEIIPRIASIDGHAGRYTTLGDQGLEVSWQLGDGGRLRVLANLGASRLQGVDTGGGRRIWVEGAVGEGELEPWSLVWSLRDA